MDNIEVGMKLHAQYKDGEFYPAEVIGKSKGKARVQFVGWEDKALLGLDKLRSKRLPKAEEPKRKAKAKDGRSQRGASRSGGARKTVPLGDEPPFCWKTFRDVPIEADEDTKIEFFTDVEGNWEYFLMFIEESEILYWKEHERGSWGEGFLQLHDNCVLVFGGDASDKGPGDIRFVKTMLSLKQRYPSRVGLILGNRDINKLRFFSELAEDQDPSSFNVYWDEKAQPFEKFMEGEIGKNLPKGPLATLHWMLNCNMGCQVTTYGNRKKELALINGQVTDEDVVQSFRDCANPNAQDPWILDFLRLGKLAIIIRDTLFVHADIPEQALGFVPGLSDEELILDSGLRWVDALNTWKDSQLNDYRQQPSWCTREQRPEEDQAWSCSAAGWRIRGGTALIDYGVPRGCGGRTVTYNNPFSNGNSQLVELEVEDLLRKWKIKRVLSGHQPHGQSPTVVRHPRTGLLRLTCDTSYSHMAGIKLFNKSNNRGKVVSVVQMRGDKTRIKGSMLGKKDHDTTLDVDPKKDKMPDALVGRQLKSGAWIKAVLDPEKKDGRRSFLTVCHGIGFKIDMSVVGETQCCFMLKDEFRMDDDAASPFAVPYSELATLTLDSELADNHELEDAPEAESNLQQHLSLLSPQGQGKGMFRRKSTFSIPEFGRYETYIFAPQGTIYSIHDPDGEDGNAEQMKLLEKEIVAKINELMSTKRVLFVSNNSSLSRKGHANRLEQMGIRFKEDPEKHIISSGYTCAWFLKQAGKKKPFVVCSHAGILEELRSVGITEYVATIHDDGKPKDEYLRVIENERTIMELVDRHPDVDCVVAGWDQQLSTLKIAVAGMYLRLKPDLKLITCSTDPSGVFSSQGGRKVHTVGNGVIANAICNAISKESNFAINVGKPSLVMLDQMRNSKASGGFEVDLSNAVMIGDTVETDIELARRGGMKSCLVFSGVTCKADYDSLDEATRPVVTWMCSTFAKM